MTKDQVISQLCDQAGCNKEARARHRNMFFANWNVHPPQDFKDYVINHWKTEELEDEEACRKTGRMWRPTARPNPITLWNSDLERQAFYQSKGTQCSP